MLQWIEEGALLGWLIDPKRERVHVYQANGEHQVVSGFGKLAGTGPVEGFVLDLRKIRAI